MSLSRVQQRSVRIGVAAAALALLLLTSCAARTNQFQQFSRAGIAYSEAVTDLLDGAGNAAMDADSMVLAETREHLSAEERQEAILEHNQLLRERIILLAELKRHTRLLRDYFEALGALAESDAPSGMATAAEGAAKALEQLHPRIEAAKVGGVPVSGFVGPVFQIAVAHFRLGALEEELRQRAPVIERELDLQQAALRAIAEQIRTDLEIQWQQREANEVVLPYVRDETLPSRWAERRRTVLQPRLALASAETAADAARQLKVAFVALAEGRTQTVAVSVLIRDIHEILSVSERTQAELEE